MAGRLEGRVALVSGAGTGIGFATAGRLRAEGATVVAAIADETQRPPLEGFDAPVLDVRQASAWQQVVERIERDHGGLDILVNNAAIHRSGTIDDTDAALWDEVMAVNLFGAFLGCQAAIRAMRRRGRGAIVNLASIASIRGVAGAVAYSASKGGVLAMTMTLAMDHVAEGIRINCVCPGAVETPIIDAMAGRAADPEALRATIAARHPMKRLARPEEIAAVIAFLASDDASFMTGMAIPVDGGRSAA